MSVVRNQATVQLRGTRKAVREHAEWMAAQINKDRAVLAKWQADVESTKANCEALQQQIDCYIADCRVLAAMIGETAADYDTGRFLVSPVLPEVRQKRGLQPYSDGVDTNAHLRKTEPETIRVRDAVRLMNGSVRLEVAVDGGNPLRVEIEPRALNNLATIMG